MEGGLYLFQLKSKDEKFYSCIHNLIVSGKDHLGFGFKEEYNFGFNNIDYKKCEDQFSSLTIKKAIYLYVYSRFMRKLLRSKHNKKIISNQVYSNCERFLIENCEDETLIKRFRENYVIINK